MKKYGTAVNIAERVGMVLLGLGWIFIGLTITVRSSVLSIPLWMGPVFGPTVILAGVLFICIGTFRWRSIEQEEQLERERRLRRRRGRF